MRIVIEVGANWGNDTEHLASSGARVYAIEPTPELIEHLGKRFHHNPSVWLYQFAIDEEEGPATFHIAGTRDWGCSSLYEFTDNIHDLWEDRPDFEFTDHIEVMRVRLDNFMDSLNLDEVDYLWIDAQGNDFRVLRSAGDRIHDIKEGKCEGAYTVDLYKETNNKVEDIVAWLEERGFECTVIPDNVGKEADVHFRRV